MIPSVLVVDDEPSVGRSLERVLGDAGYKVVVAPTAATGVARAEAERPMVVLLDHNLPDGSGLDVLTALLELDPRMRVVVITAFGDTSLAVQCIKAGACDFLTKPYDMEKLLHTVEAARREYEAQLELSLYRMREHRSGATHRMVGESPALLEVLSVVGKVARSNATSVLLSGESGTGKELVARAIHDLSDRSGAPFTDLNCSSISEGLLENELFGH
ncbi:MAG TPA: response regulator, partial [Candidatus Eisenbacteria bacterium]|nr:response regulator [Candidatus Eisenbacteria bacterium]